MNQVHTTELFPSLDAKLIELLSSLAPEQWALLATPKWTVKEVTSHLLDSNLRRLSIARDGHWGEPFNGSSYQDLVDFLNGLNADWVRAMRRVSPRILIELLAVSNREVSDHFRSMDPKGTATFPVSWAGEEYSQNWFDIAREYTEKWHHQQQIREAVGAPDIIMSRQLYHPVLDTFLRALPQGFKDLEAPSGTSVAVHVTGEAGGTWYMNREARSWSLSDAASEPVRAEVQIPQELAWKLFTKALSREAARTAFRITGDPRLIEPVLATTAIMG